MLQPVLLESQIQAIAMAAGNRAKQLPYFQPKDLNSKKPINREIQVRRAGEEGGRGERREEI